MKVISFVWGGVEVCVSGKCNSGCNSHCFLSCAACFLPFGADDEA